ncbi:hypothetical protein K4F52_010284 [Lecanicillium sp. MT-2017a]|nr:hypothetical protein K4F52_010284 [Lecanicillium sp. MT-2017a]
MAFDNDSETLKLAIELQQQEAESLLKGKCQEGDVSDLELAARLFQDDLEHYQAFQFDKVMSRSIAQATLTDAEAIRDIIGDEGDGSPESDAQFQEEHLSREDVPRGETVQACIDDELLGKLAAMGQNKL